MYDRRDAFEGLTLLLLTRRVWFCRLATGLLFYLTWRGRLLRLTRRHFRVVTCTAHELNITAKATKRNTKDFFIRFNFEASR